MGHHLDVAQATDNYSKIFNGTPVAERDVVFRRYSIPGVAHVEYWEDVELFKGIIKEVIEKDANSLGSFAKKSFWEKDDKIYKTEQQWAYFRIPFITAVITFLLLIYGLTGFWFCTEKCHATWSHIVAILAAILLWACPDPSKAYRHEGSPDTEERKKSGIWQKIKPRRSIFAHLVAAAVGWRQVLKVLRKRQRQESEQKEQAKKEQQAKEDFQRGGFWKLGWPRYVVAVTLVAIPGFFLGWPPKIIPSVILLFGLTYLCVMLYVLVVYLKAKP